MSKAPKACTCRFCGDKKTPQGIRNHETHCDDNPNKGIPYEDQLKHGILEDAGDSDETGPDPNQNGDSSGLPEVTQLRASKSITEDSDGQTAKTDGGKDEGCPKCGSSDVLSAAEARDFYLDAVDSPNKKAVLAYNLAEESCQNTACAALWGGKFEAAYTMEEIVNA